MTVTGADRTVTSLAPFGTAVGSAVADAPELLLRAAPRVPLLRSRLRFVVRCRNVPTPAAARCARSRWSGAAGSPVLLARAALPR